MTANGQPDQSRSARYVLKDYVNGKLLFCHAPPDRKQEEFHTYAPRVRRELQEAALPVQQQRAMRVKYFPFKFKSHVHTLESRWVILFRFQLCSQINKTQTTSEIDKNFFRDAPRIAYIKGKSNLPHIRGLAREGESAASSSASVNGSTQSLDTAVDKPWRHQKKEKREKLRKKFVHLDQH